LGTLFFNEDFAFIGRTKFEYIAVVSKGEVGLDSFGKAYTVEEVAVGGAIFGDEGLESLFDQGAE